MLTSFSCGEFFLHLFWLLFSFSFFYLGIFHHTSRDGFIFMWGVLLHIPYWLHFLSGEFLLHIPCWIYFYVWSFYYTSHACFIFVWGVSLAHPMLTFFSFFFKSGKFLLHIPSWLHCYAGSFSYTFRIGFIFILGVFPTHPACFLCLCVCVWEGGGREGGFSYIFHAGFSLFF